MKRSGRKYTQYKGLKSYLEIVSKNPKLSQFGDLIINSPHFKIKVKSYDNKIEIDEEWVQKIEFYLPFVSNCIQEGRRHILNTGETIAIEKVKKVDKESVINLSKNSANIRKLNDLGEVEPRRLYIIEKNDDYALYENRFLVFLLYMLKSFVDIRFDKIKDAQSKVEIEADLKNTINVFKDTIDYSINVNDIRHNELKVEENDVNRDIINRILGIESSINQLIETELIRIVSKSPLISEPIQKNNVLKNDPNFKKAVELYEFLKSYNKDGYKIEQNETISSSLSEDYLRIFKYIPLVLTFLSYSEVKNLFPLLENEYQDELKDIHDTEIKLLRMKVEEIFNNEELNKEDIVRYILKLEEELETKSLFIEKEKERYEKEIDEIILKAKSDLSEMKYRYEDEIKKITKEKDSIADSFNKLSENHKALKVKYENDVKELKARIKALNIKLDPDNEIDEVSEEEFNVLESELIAFIEYFEKRWKNVKKDIKKKHMKEIRRLLKTKERLEDGK